MVRDVSRTREPRPQDVDFYAQRSTHLRQGDLFREIPLGQPFPPDALHHQEGSRRFLSGPFEPGFGMLLSPTCSMAAQGGPEGYAHPFRVIAPVLAVADLVEQGALKPGALEELRRADHLQNYFYLPPIDAVGLPESAALLYAPITLHHDYLEDRRVAQLSSEAAVHLKRQLAAHFSGALFSHAAFED